MQGVLMRKTTAVLMVSLLLMAAMLVGCGSKAKDSESSGDQAGASAANSESVEEDSLEGEAAAEEEPINPHIVYKDLRCTAVRQGDESSSTIYVVLELTATCDVECGFEDQAVVYYQVNDGQSYDMWPIPVDEKKINGSYSNEPLSCSARFEASPGDSVKFWIKDPRSGATYEGLDGIVDELTVATERAIQSAPSRAGAADSRVCYVVPDGKAYHRVAGCPRLGRSDVINETTVAEAKERGLEACESCY